MIALDKSGFKMIIKYILCKCDWEAIFFMWVRSVGWFLFFKKQIVMIKNYLFIQNFYQFM